MSRKGFFYTPHKIKGKSLERLEAEDGQKQNLGHGPCWVSTGKAKQGTAKSSGLARLNYASRLRDIAAVSSCSVPSSRII